MYDCIGDAEEEDFKNKYPLDKINETTTTCSFLIRGGSSCSQNYQEKNRDPSVDSEYQISHPDMYRFNP